MKPLETLPADARTDASTVRRTTNAGLLVSSTTMAKVTLSRSRAWSRGGRMLPPLPSRPGPPPPSFHPTSSPATISPRSSRIRQRTSNETSSATSLSTETGTGSVPSSRPTAPGTPGWVRSPVANGMPTLNGAPPTTGTPPMTVGSAMFSVANRRFLRISERSTGPGWISVPGTRSVTKIPPVSGSPVTGGVSRKASWPASGGLGAAWSMRKPSARFLSASCRVAGMSVSFR